MKFVTLELDGRPLMRLPVKDDGLVALDIQIGGEHFPPIAVPAGDHTVNLRAEPSPTQWEAKLMWWEGPLASSLPPAEGPQSAKVSPDGQEG